MIFVSFDDTGVVDAIGKLDKDDGSEIEVVNRETPTAGQRIAAHPAAHRQYRAVHARGIDLPADIALKEKRPAEPGAFLSVPGRSQISRRARPAARSPRC